MTKALSCAAAYSCAAVVLPTPALPTTHDTLPLACASSNSSVSSRNAAVSQMAQSAGRDGAVRARIRRNISSLMLSKRPFRMVLIVPALMPSELTALFWLGYRDT